MITINSLQKMFKKKVVGVVAPVVQVGSDKYRAGGSQGSAEAD